MLPSPPVPAPALTLSMVRLCLCVLLTALSLTAAGTAHGFSLFGTAPESAITLAQKGIDEANPDDFNKAVDLDSVVNNAADALMDALQQLAAEGALDDSKLGLMIGLMGAVNNSSQAGFIKQFLVSELRGFVNTGIKSGYFAGREDADVKASQGSLSSLLTRLAKGRRVLSAGKVLDKKDGKATMEALFTDPKAGSFPLTLGLVETDGQWRVVEILNARDLFNEAMRRNK